jgi:hypothetical protein
VIRLGVFTASFLKNRMAEFDVKERRAPGSSAQPKQGEASYYTATSTDGLRDVVSDVDSEGTYRCIPHRGLVGSLRRSGAGGCHIPLLAILVSPPLKYLRRSRRAVAAQSYETADRAQTRFVLLMAPKRRAERQ